MAHSTRPHKDSACELLFINKTPQSKHLSRSTGPTATSINSHVQLWLKGKDPSTSSGKGRDVAPRRVKSADAATPVPQLPRRTRRFSDSHWPDEDHSTDATDDKRKAERTSPPWRHESSHALLPPTTTSMDLPLFTANFSGPDCIDPFACTAVPMGKEVQPIIAYYLHYSLSATDAQAHTTHETAIHTIIRGCLSNKMHMYFLLCATAALMRYISRVAGSTTHDTRPEQYLQKGLPLLRHHLASYGNDTDAAVLDRQVVLDIFYLCVCEWYARHFQAARMHLEFVRRFWSCLDAERSELDRYALEMISYNDIFLAIETGVRSESTSPSRQEQIAHVPLALPSSQEIECAYASTPRLTTVCKQDVLSTELLSSAIPLLLDLIKLSHHARIYSQPTTTPAHTKLISRNRHALLHRLSSHSNTSIRLALIIPLCSMSASAAWRLGQVDPAKLAERLREALSEVQVQTPAVQRGGYASVLDRLEITWPGRRILVWVLATGAFEAMDSVDAEWERLEVQVRRELVRARMWAELREVVLRYLNVGGLVATGLGRLAARLEVLVVER